MNRGGMRRRSRDQFTFIDHAPVTSILDAHRGRLFTCGIAEHRLRQLRQKAPGFSLA